MTEKEWARIEREAMVESQNSIGAFNHDPRNWAKVRALFMEYATQVDKATEVYFRENPKERPNE